MEEHAANIAENLKSAQKDPNVDGLFYFLPKKLISKFNTDKDNYDFVVPFKKIQQKKPFNNESKQ